VIPLYVYVAAGVAIAGCSFTAGWKVNGWRYDSVRFQETQQRAQEGRRQAGQIDRAAEAFEARQAAADAREADLERRTYAELQKPAARLQCLSPDGLRILADAAAESNTRRGAAAALPAASGPR
jgi:hypothetical protein